MTLQQDLMTLFSLKLLAFEPEPSPPCPNLPLRIVLGIVEAIFVLIISDVRH